MKNKLIIICGMGCSGKDTTGQLLYKWFKNEKHDANIEFIHQYTSRELRDDEKVEDEDFFNRVQHVDIHDMFFDICNDKYTMLEAYKTELGNQYYGFLERELYAYPYNKDCIKIVYGVSFNVAKRMFDETLKSLGPDNVHIYFLETNPYKRLQRALKRYTEDFLMKNPEKLFEIFRRIQADTEIGRVDAYDKEFYKVRMVYTNYVEEAFAAGEIRDDILKMIKE